MSTWKKVHVEDANTTHGTITATLSDNTTDGAAGAVELVMVGGTGEQELQRQTYTFGSNAFNSTTIGTTTNTLIDGAGIGDFSFDGSGAATVAVDIANATDLGNSVASGDLLLVADIDDSNNIKKTSVADIVGAVSSGVTSVDITGDGGTHDAQSGAVSLDFSGTSDSGISVTVSDTGAEINLDIDSLGALTPASADAFIFRDNSGDNKKVTMSVLSRTILNGGELTETTLTSSTIDTSDTFLVADGGRNGAANDISLAQLTAYFNDVSILTNLATNTDVDVSDANLRTRLAALDNSATINIGDADDDCTVVIRGNLQVDGTTTTVNSTTLTVDDINITVASGAANAAAADGAGITVDADADGGYASNPQLQWNATHEAFSQWKMVKGVTGETDAFIAGMVSAADTTALDALTPGIGTLGMVGGDLYIQTA